MGKAIEDWTDQDYAQAAIDMLPGTVEEIGEFLRAQGIKNSGSGDGNTCPLTKWIRRWTDNRRAFVGPVHVYPFGLVHPESLPLPPSARAWVREYDLKKVRL